MRERRRFKRYNAAFDADYMKVAGHTTISSLTRTKNISLGGICADLSSLVKKGDELMVGFSSPPNNKGMTALVKVRWARRGEEHNGSTCGLEFLWITSKAILGGYLSFAEGVSTAA